MERLMLVKENLQKNGMKISIWACKGKTAWNKGKHLKLVDGKRVWCNC